LDLRKFGIVKTDLYSRTKEELIEDTVLICNNKDLKKGTKFKFIREDVAPTWTEMMGKYIGCRYWSKVALEDIYLERLGKGIQGNALFQGLEHDHVVPRVLFEELLILHDVEINGEFYFEKLFQRLTGFSFIHTESLKKLFSFLVGAVITNSQHLAISRFSGMPDEFYNDKNINFGNIWIRYLMEGIEIYEVEWDGSEIVDYTPINKNE
jgi:hypothetical protein